MKKHVWKGLTLLICCVVLLLACSAAALAADGAGAQLENGGIMPVSTTGQVAVPADGMWTGIVTNPSSCLSLSNGTLTVKSLPTGTDHYDAVAELTLDDETVVNVGLVIYNPDYLTFIPVPNGSFETVSDGMPVNWEPSTTTTAKLSASTEHARTGTVGAELVMTGQPGVGFRSVYTGIPARVGCEYIAASYALNGGIGDTVKMYLEFWDTAGDRLVYHECSYITPDYSSWSKMEINGQAPAGTAYATVVPYSSKTSGTVYFDDAILFEVAWAGVLDQLNELLANGASDDELFNKLATPSLDEGLSLNIAKDADSKALYLEKLKAAYNNNAPLTKNDIVSIAAEVTQHNQNLVDAAVAKISTSRELTSLGLIAPPSVSNELIEMKWAGISGNTNRIQMLDGGATLLSRPAIGSPDESVTMRLTVFKGNYSTTVDIATTIPAYTQTSLELKQVAEGLDLGKYLTANCVTSVPTLPPTLNGDIDVDWVASSNIDLSAGTITRPAYGEPDALVTLTATLNKGGESYTHNYPVIVAAMGVEEARTVLTKNVGFEGNIPTDNTAPTGWLKTLIWANNLQGTGHETTHANVATDFAYTGSQSLRLNASPYGELASVQNEVVTTGREGYIYSLQVMTYAGDGADPAIHLKFLDNEGLVIAVVTKTYADDSGAVGMWKNLTASAVAPAGTVMVVAELDAGLKTTQTWFDDVRLREWPLVPGDSSTGKVLNVNPGSYIMSVNANGGTATLTFTGASTTTYTKALTNGLNAFPVYAPAGTTGVTLAFTGTVSDVKLTPTATGTAVAGGDFASSSGTPWTLSDADIYSGILSVSGGTATSAPIPVEDGKSYVFAVDVLGSGTLTVNPYNVLGTLDGKNTLTKDFDCSDWTTVTLSWDALPAFIHKDAGSNPDHTYALMVLSGSADFDNARVYSVSTSVSNPSMENTKVLPYGSFPYNWSSFGTGAAYVANQAGQFHSGVKGLAFEPFGSQTGIRSSYLKDVKADQQYEATIWAKGTNAKLNIEFWNADFTKLSTTSTTISGNSWKEYSVIGTAPSNAAYVSLSVSGTGTTPVYVDDGAIVPVVRTIGTNVQLFLDDWLIDSADGVERTFHSGSKQYAGGAFGAYSGSIQWDPYAKVYKMWHRQGEGDPAKEYFYYRTTTDLSDPTKWSKPIMCTDASGLKFHGGGYVHIDVNETDKDKLYKGMLYNDVDSFTDGAYQYYTSPDGVKWTKVEGAQIVPGYDVHTLSYDPVNDEYIMTYKEGHPRGLVEGQKRVHKVAVSKDLMTWTEGVRMYTVGTPMDTVEQNVIRTDGYGNGMYALGDSYVSLNWRTLLNESESFGGQMDSNLLFSRDLTEDWQRLEDEDGNAVLAIPRDNAVMGGVYNRPADWHEHQMYTANEPIQVGDETWWHYYGHSYDHGHNDVATGQEKTVYAAYAVWRRNGFASMDFAAGGTMTTQPFTLAGEVLRLNAEGELTVKLLDEGGNPLATTSFDGDSVDQVLLWNTNVTDCLGQTVKLQFTSASGGAKLYSIQMGDIPQDYNITAPTVPHGTVTVDATGMAGTAITVTGNPEKDYELAELTVTGTSGAVTATKTAANTFTFTMPGEDVTVSAKFWPKGSIWHEDFDGFAAGDDVFASGSNIKKVTGNFFSGNASAKIVTPGELTLTASGGAGNRATIATNKDFSGSYAVEVRLKATPSSTSSVSRFTGLYLSEVKFPRAAVSSGNLTGYGTIKYDLRFYPSSVVSVELNRALAAGADTGTSGVVSTYGNMLTGGVDGSLTSGTNYSKNSRMYLYPNGNPNNVVTDTAAVTYTSGNWYIVKIFVDDAAKTVTTELWDGTGTTKLGSRTLFDAVINSGSFQIESFYDNTAVIDYITVKPLACPHDSTVSVSRAEPSCTQPGHEAGTKCADCGEPISGMTEIPALGHSYKGVVTEPTCAAGGYTTYTCSACGDSYKGSQVPALEHSYNGVVTEPTCKAGGYTTYTCSGCGDSYKDNYVSALPHTEEEIPGVEPTLDSEGQTAGVKCSVCDTVIVEPTVIPKLNKLSATAFNGTVTFTVNGQAVETASAGDAVTVTVTPNAGYELHSITGTATLTMVNNSTYTFTMPASDMTVTPDFWPVGAKFYEGFDSYSKGDDVFAADSNIKKVTGNFFAGNASAEIVTPGELTLTASGGTGNRATIATNQNFSDSYTVEVRLKPTTLDSSASRFTGLYLSNVTFPRYDPNKKVYGTIKYDLRFYPKSTVSVELNRALAAGADTGTTSVVSTNGNILTGGVDGGLTSNANYSANSRMYLYPNGNPNNVVTDTAAVTYTSGDWYTVRIYVDADSKTVTTVLLNSDASTVLGSRTLFDAVISNGSFQIESFYDNTVVIDYIAVKDYECPHISKVAVDQKDATCTETGHTAGTKCALCGEVLSGMTEIPLADHDEVIIPPVDPTFETEGRTWGKTCSVCDEVLVESTVIPKLTKINATAYNGALTFVVDGRTVSAASAGDTVTVTATPTKGFNLHSIASDVVDLAMDEDGAYTFTMPAEAVTVTAHFWPEGRIWHDDFDTYGGGLDILTASGTTLTTYQATNGTVTTTVEIDEDGTKVLKLTAKDDHSSGTNANGTFKASRSWLKSKSTVSAGSYTIKTRFKCNDVAGLTSVLRLDGITFKRYDSAGTSVTTNTGHYELRVQNGKIFFPLTYWDKNVRITNDASNMDTSSEAYLYDTNGVKVPFAANTWYTAIVSVNYETNTITTVLYDDAGNMLGSRVLKDAAIKKTAVTMDNQSVTAASTAEATNAIRESFWDYILVKDYECPHTSTTTVPGYDATVTAPGLTDGLKCTDCDAIVKEQESIPALGKISLVGRTLILDEDVYIYVGSQFSGFGDIDLEANGGLLVWTGDAPENPVYGTQDHISEGLTPEGDFYAARTHGIPAKSYADKVYFRAYLEVDGTYVYGPLTSYSVQDYCKYQLANTTDENLKAVCSEMLHYGAAAQTEFNYNSNSPASAVSGIPTSGQWQDSYLTELAAIPEPKDFIPTVQGDWQASLSLDSLVTMYLAFAPENGISGTAELLVWKEGEDLFLKNADCYEMSTTMIGGSYTGSMNGTCADEYGKTVFACVKITDGDTVTYSQLHRYSVEAYADYWINQNTSDVSLTRLCKQLVLYGEAAKTYFENK